MNSTISIIFPTFNGVKFLKRNLNSIVNLENSSNIEIVIVDNNSKDSSIDIINSFKSKLNITLKKMEKNTGFAYSCNIGAKLAKGEFIFITNQDIVFPHDFFTKLELLYQELYNGIEIIISPAIVFENGRIHYFGAKIHYLGFSYTPELNKKLPLKKIVKTTYRFSGGSVFLKKDLFLNINGFDPFFFMYYEDTDLSLRLMRKQYPIYTTNDPYLIHQKHDWTISDFRYFFLERNRYLVYLKNIDDFKKLFPIILIIEIILIFQSILLRKFNLKIRVYYNLFKKLGFYRELRKKSSNCSPLISHSLLSRKLDSMIIGNFKYEVIFGGFFKILNYLLNLI